MNGAENHGRQGFVLVEILVALSVVAIMAALMAGFFNQMRSVASLKEEIFARTELSAAASHLQRTLSGLRNAPLPDNGPTENYVFEGTAEAMRFAAVTRQGFYSLALRDVELFVDRAGGITQLVQQAAPRRPGAGDEPMTVVILDGIDAVYFEYANDKGAYTAAWHKEALPSAVRMTLHRELGPKRISASVIARVF